MKPLTRHNRALFNTFAVMFAAGCALIGNQAPFPGPVNTAGMGPFRLLTDDETGLGDSAPIDASSARLSIDRAQVVGDSLFFGGAVPLADPPARDAELRLRDVDWGQYESRSIWRTRGEVDLAFSFTDAAEVLTASAAWEGGWVGEPFVLELADGRVRLFYAAQGGIGVAESSSVDGTFARVGDAPIVPGSDLGSPSVIEMPSGEFLMYLDDGMDIWLARSSDGLGFTRDPAPLDLAISAANATDDDLEEVARVAASAVVATTPVGRQVVRLYADVLGAVPDGRPTDDRVVLAAASVDGTTFSRSALPALDPVSMVDDGEDDFVLGSPTPRILDTGETLLYLTRNTTYPVDNAVVSVVGQRLVVSVAPAFAELPGFVTPSTASPEDAIP